MKNISKILLCLLLLHGLFLHATKGIEKKLQRADQLYGSGSYGAALELYLEVFSSDSANCDLNFKIGDCYLRTDRSSSKAEYHLKKSVNSVSADMEQVQKQKAAPLDAYKLYGEALHLNYKFAEALTQFENYKSALKKARVHDNLLLKDLERKMQICRNALELVEHPAEVKVVNLGGNINSKHPDYSPHITADQNTMIYTSRRPENIGGKTYDEGLYFEDIYIATRNDTGWNKGSNLGEPINTVGNEAAIAISADGQQILIYKDDMGDGNIYSSMLEGDKWSVPSKLNSNINSKFWEPCAFISADGKTLYFVSDRPGGYGGTDIYRSEKTTSGDWGRAVNLGPTINTPYDEYSPFIHPDGVTLFFSSKGHKTMGGYDIFFSRKLMSDDRIWLEPTNVGYPINSPADDAFYMVTPDKQSAYYSSRMNGGMGEKDNYMVTFPEPENSPLSLVKGTITKADAGVLRNMKITITDNQTGKIVGEYKPNSKTGKYSYILTPGHSYNIAYEADGMLFFSENRYVSESTNFTESDQPVSLPGAEPGAKVVLNNIFFDFDQAVLKPNSATELDRIYRFMTANPNVCIELAGFADSRGNDDYNKRLSKARAQSVVEYLSEKGVGRDRMKAVGYGEIKKDNKTVQSVKPDDLAAIASQEKERRVELKIINIKNNQ